MFALSLQLASVLLAAEADRRGLVRSGLWLLIALSALGAALVAVMWVFASLWSRRARRSPPKVRRRPPVPDAWSEAGRRAQPLPPDDAQPGNEGETWSPSEN